MKLSATFSALKVDCAKFKRALHEQLSSALAESCRVWLTTVVRESTDVGLPIWSAASISTLSPLASRVGFDLVNMPLDGVASRIEYGMANGDAKFEPGTEKPGLYTFTYRTSLPHLIINEKFDANAFVNPKTEQPYFHLKHPGPYHFQEKGEKAFRAFASTLVLPGLGSILEVATIHVG